MHTHRHTLGGDRWTDRGNHISPHSDISFVRVLVCRFRDPSSLANGKHNSTNDRHRHGSMMSIYSLCALEITRARYYCCDTGVWPSGLVGGCDTERSHTLNHTGTHTHTHTTVRWGDGKAFTRVHLHNGTCSMAVCSLPLWFLFQFQSHPIGFIKAFPCPPIAPLYRFSTSLPLHQDTGS